MNCLSRLFDMEGNTGTATEASHGFGVWFAKCSTKIATKVLWPARRFRKEQHVGESILPGGGSVHAQNCYVRDTDKMKSEVEGAKELPGREDIVVNHSGVNPGGNTMLERIPKNLFLEAVQYMCRQL